MPTPRPSFRFACVLLSTLATFAPRAVAQDALTMARAELDAARFEEALRLYDREAARDEGLDRARLVRLLRERSLARAALRDLDGARRDLLALFSLEPSAELGQEAPPSLARLADEVRASVRAPLRVDADATPVEGGYEVRTRVEGDVASLVRAIRVLEIRDDGAVERHEGRVVRIASDGPLRYVVEAVSLGGAVVASVGTPAAPRSIGSARSELAPISAGGDDSGPWIAAGVAGGIAVAIAVVIALALTLPDGNTRLGVPMELP